MLIAKFEAAADKYSAHTAIKTQDREIRYGELNQSANILAQRLRPFFKRNPETPHAALFFSYGSGMITALLAALKAGGVYVPMDTAYPENRLQYMLEHSNACVILTDNKGMAAAKRIAGNVNRDIGIIDIDEPGEDKTRDDKAGDDNTGRGVTDNPPPDAEAGDSPAYILYTSGSTGLPKGVLQTRKNVWYYTRNWIERFAITASDRMTLLTAFNHDGAVQDIFSALCSGAALILHDIKNAVNSRALADFIREEQISIWHSVPTLFRYFTDSLTECEQLPSFPHLRYILLGGEALRSHDIDSAARYFPGVKLANVYGQTESSVNSIHIISPQEGYDRPLLGEPLDETEIFLVDEDGDEVEEFGSGEILVACPHIASGYWRDPQLSEKVFSDDDEFGRLYWTGDLGRMISEGRIQMMGRRDHQVKIRGFRVETGEIETALLRHKAISEAVVILRQEESGEPFLCAYFVAAETLSLASLREYLMDRVPDYMVPAHFMRLETMPLTATGKVDRSKLPQPEAHDGEAAFAAPRDDIEKELAAIWARVLSLKEKEIGLDEDFFQLGGHSLKAVTMSLNIHQRLHVRISLPVLFSLSTIRRQAQYIRSADRQRHLAIEAVEEREYYPLTPAQTRLYILHQMEEGLTLYNLPVTVQLEGELDERRLEQAFNGIIRRHESLRTSFMDIGGSPFQKIHQEVAFEIGNIESGELRVRPFDLGRAPLFRVDLKQSAPSRWTMMADMHHIVSDGTSMALLIREFMALYRGGQLEQPQVRYRDYSCWLLGGADGRQSVLEKQREFWRDMYRTDAPVLNLPLDFPRPPVRRFDGAQVFFRLEAGLTAALKQLAKDGGMTLYMTLLGVHAVFLSKICAQEDIVTGTPTAGRGHAQLEHTVGMFVNTLAIRSFPRSNATVKEFLGGIKETTLKSFENQDYPFEELVEQLNLDKDASRNPIFDTMFVLQNFDVRGSGIPEIEIPGLVMRPVVTENRVSKFDLTLTAFEGPDHIQLVMGYCTYLFKRDTIQRFSGFFKTVAHAMTARPQARLADIEIISDREKELILNTFNNPDYPDISIVPGKTIQQRFRDQALKTPHRIALAGKDNRSYWSYRTYKQLDQDSEGLEKAGAIIPIKMERSIDFVTRIIAVLKTGAAYLPIDPELPEERIDYMLKDSKAGFVSRAASQPSAAYIIYTSGSTGRPKGVVVEHGGVLSLTSHFNETILGRHAGPLAVGLMAPFVFDASVLHMFAALLSGNRLDIVPDEIKRDGAALLDFTSRYVLDVLEGGPGHLSMMLEAVETFGFPASLKHIISGGDVLTQDLVKRLASVLGDKMPILTNMYGPTECTVAATAYTITPGNTEEVEVIPIGKPLDNYIIHILDQNGLLQPIGIPGELHIAGPGVARGYLNNPELTAERFTPAQPGHRSHRSYRSYKTGDIGRWLPDGNIQFLGRKDHQVKIRGFRIELGEIETRLKSYPSVKDAAVIEHISAGGDNMVCAYIVPTAGDKDITGAKEYLARHLPSYMIPSFFISLDKLPLTPSGKLDPKALPEPGVVDKEPATQPPANRIETELAAIWSGVLGLETGLIGRDSNFFQLGGHSLRASIMAARAHKKLGVPLPLSEVFRAPTLAGLAGYIDRAERESFNSIPNAKEQHSYALSAAQERLYVLQNMDKSNTGYNITSGVTLEGRLDMDKLGAAFDRLVQRHESLRTSFVMEDGEPRQRIHEQVDFQVEFRKIRSEEAMAATASFIRPFDLTRAPLLRVGVFRTGSQSHILVMDIHHSVSDGTSCVLLVREFTALYAGVQLPPVRLQYKDFSQWQNSPLQQRRISGQKRFWLEVYSQIPEPLELPLDYPRPDVQSFEGAALDFRLDRQETAALKQLASGSETTLFMTLLAVYHILLWRLSGQSHIVIGTPSAGRGHSDLENVTGMFVNTLALRLFGNGDTSFQQLLAAVKSHTLAAFENQDYPFEELVNQLSVPRDTGRHPLFDTMFSWQNFQLQGDELPTVPVPELTVKPLAYKKETTHFDLELAALERSEEIVFRIDYCRKLFKEETIRRWSHYFKRIAAQVARRPQVRLADIDILSPEEKEQLLTEFNDTSAPLPESGAIHEIFAQQAERSPHRIALAGKDNRSYWSYRTYKQLHRESSVLAEFLVKKGAGPGMIVALEMERSIDMIVAILGVLKSGAAYLPIDPALPEERIDYMLKDSNALPVDGIEEASPGSTLPSPDSPAYVIYTSGSTGQPKGVLIPHGGVVNMVAHLNGVVFKHEHRPFRVGMVAPFVFDASVMHMFGALLAGNGLYLVPDEVKIDGAGLLAFVARYCLDVLEGTPTHLAMILEAAEIKKKGLPACVKHITMGGDVLPKHLVQRLAALTDPDFPRLTNMYGPTECSVMATTYPVPLTAVHALNSIPIGKPLMNYRIYILDEWQNPQPIGVTGEIIIGGAGLGTGYLNNPELTAQRFTPAQPGHRSNGSYKSYRSYKTGDLGYWLADGNITFVGRGDQQVKVRGYRIELGEIEHQLLNHPAVKEAVVVARRRTGDPYLCAYLIMTDKKIAEPATVLRKHLAQTLPAYMIPAAFVVLDAFPLTASNKIDRRALPEPAAGQDNRDFITPAGSLEEFLASKVSALLGIPMDKVSGGANLFEMGASSMSMVKLAAAVHKELDIEVPVFEIFKHPSIKELAMTLAQSQLDRWEEDEFSLFNPGKARKIWGFPPAMGYGFAYAGLAEQLKEFTVYGFNFIPEPDRLDRYVDMMTEHQPQGPYTLFSYSAGGELTLEVANRLEERGYEVAALLLLDCQRSGAIPNGPEKNRFPQQFMQTVEKSIRQLGLLYLKDRVEAKIAAYSDYFHETRELHPVRADIHLLKALKPKERAGDRDSESHSEPPGWQELVRSGQGWFFREYQASGHHGEMLESGHLEKNAATIRRILELDESRRLLSSHREIHNRLSRTGAAFLDYVKQHPEVLEFSQFGTLDLNDEMNRLQPWPLFVNGPFKQEMAQASVEVCRLIKSLPGRLFGNDIAKLSDYYELPVHMIEAQLRNSDEGHLEYLLGRGDFLWTQNGFKCLEFNITASLGGIDLPAWLQLYRNVPVISRFIKKHKVKICNRNLHDLFLAHMIRAASLTEKPKGSEATMNAALVIDGIGANAKTMESFLAPLYARQLQELKPGTQGSLIVCDYPQVGVRGGKPGNTVIADGKTVDVLVEMYNGVVPPEILELERQKRVTVLNGPITGLMTNKLNLALLSEHRESDLFQPHEKEIIAKYIPWSRKTERGGGTAGAGKTTSPEGKTVNLEEYLYKNKDRLILKPSAGYGGAGIVIGKNTSEEKWGQAVKLAFEQRKWLAQEYIASLPLVYQSGAGGCAPHDVVWGLFVLGDVYAGGALRLLPKGTGDGVINAAQGATVGVVFEVEE